MICAPGYKPDPTDPATLQPPPNLEHPNVDPNTDDDAAVTAEEPSTSTP